MKKKSLILSGLLLAISAIFFNQSDENSAIQPAALQQQDSWQSFNSKSWKLEQPNSHQQRILTAKYMQETGDLISLEQPFIEILDADKLVTLTSKTAKIENHNLYNFYQQVELNQYVSNQENNRLLLTEQLSYNQTENLASSDLAVKIISGQQITDAIGMQYDLESRQLNLNSQVKTLYEPQNSSNP